MVQETVFCFLPSNYLSNKRGRQLQFDIPRQLSAEHRAFKCPFAEHVEEQSPVSAWLRCLAAHPAVPRLRSESQQVGYQCHSSPEAGRQCPHSPWARHSEWGHKTPKTTGCAQGQGTCLEQGACPNSHPRTPLGNWDTQSILIPRLGCKLFL